MAPLLRDTVDKTGWSMLNLWEKVMCLFDRVSIIYCHIFSPILKFFITGHFGLKCSFQPNKWAPDLESTILTNVANQLLDLPKEHIYNSELN